MSAVRPLALGYIREDAAMSDTQVAEATRALAEFADREGYALGTVYVERLERTPAAFEALIASAIREEAVAVILPGPHRVAMISAASTVRPMSPLDAPINRQTIPQSGEAGALSTTRPHVEVRARLAVPTVSPRHRDPNSSPGAGAVAGDSLDLAGPGRATWNEHC